MPAMAIGAGDEYWKEQALPSVFKHTLLDKYMPQFAGMTGSAARGRRVVYLDGYAGRGRYEDGTRASVERILTIAQNQHRNAGLDWTCFFVEQDDESAVALVQVTAEYAAVGVTVFAHHGAVLEVLDDVIAAAAGVPLFLFLDPCGLGVPYHQLTELLSTERSQTWPPTEILLNFSLEAVRRIGGHVISPKGNETTMARLDATVGGPWWRQRFAAGVINKAVTAVVQEFCTRLGADTGMTITSVPVRRAPTHKPIYHLVFGTRSPYGLWVFGDSTARATQAWWDSREEVEADADPNALFTMAATMRPSLDTIEEVAVGRIAENLAALLAQHGDFKVVDHTIAVFGEHYGQVRDLAVRKAVQELHKQGRTASDGRGGRPRELRVIRPASP
jgi:three-Cys-motif partner protein